MIKIKLLISSLFLCVLISNAQLPVKGDWTTRLGNDPKKATEAKEMYRQIFLSKESPSVKGNETMKVGMDFYERFKRLDSTAPFCSYYLYNGHLFEEKDNYENKRVEKSVFQRMLDSIPDPAVRMIIVDDILNLATRFINDLDSINVVRNNRDTTQKAIDDTLSIPVAMSKYAHLYYKYAGNPQYYPANLYDKEKARKNYMDAFRIFREQNMSSGKELEAFYVYEYYEACEDLYLSDTEKYFEQFLEDYIDIVKTCDNLLIPYYDVPDSIKNDKNKLEYSTYQSYNNFTNNLQINTITGDSIFPIKYRFKLCGAATPERLQNFYSSRLDSHRNDTAFLEHALHLMTENGAMNNNTYFDYCRASYKLRPTYENCIGMGMSVREDDINKMREYYQEALYNADTPEKKVIVYYMIGMSTYSSPLDYVNKVRRDASTLRLNVRDGYEEWEKEMEIGNASLANIIALADEIKDSRSMEIRDYPARAHYMIGTNLRWKAYVDCSPSLFEEAKKNIMMAETMGIKAKAITEKTGVHISDVLSFIDKYSENARNLRKSNRGSDVDQRAYREYLRKKRIEESFWKMK